MFSISFSLSFSMTALKVSFSPLPLLPLKFEIQASFSDLYSPLLTTTLFSSSSLPSFFSSDPHLLNLSLIPLLKIPFSSSSYFCTFSFSFSHTTRPNHLFFSSFSDIAPIFLPLFLVELFLHRINCLNSFFSHQLSLIQIPAHPHPSTFLEAYL